MIIIPRLGLSALGNEYNYQTPLIDVQDVQVDEPQVLNRIDSAEEIHEQDSVSNTSDETLEEICIERAYEINEAQAQTFRNFQDAQQHTSAKDACMACAAIPVCAALIAMPIGLSFLFAEHLDSDLSALSLGLTTTVSFLTCCAIICDCCNNSIRS